LWEQDSSGVGSGHAPLACLVAGLLALFLTFIATICLRRYGRWADDSSLTLWWRKLRSRLMRRRPPLTGDANAFLWRDAGGCSSALRAGLRLSIWAIFFLCTWLAYLWQGEPPEKMADALRSGLGVCLWLHLAALAPLLAAASNAFAGERNRRTLELLLASPARENEIISGKMQALFLHFGPLLFLPAFYGALLAWQGVLPSYGGAISAGSTAIAGFFLAIFAAYAGMFLRPIHAIWLSLGALAAAGAVGGICASGFIFLGLPLSLERSFLPYWLTIYPTDLSAYREAPWRLFANWIFCLAWHALLALLLLRHLTKKAAHLLRCSAV
ncbi:MAG: ABC transporter permease subunit, partial [Planctomycetota bacterium]|nr:ABC transporter permease subunit [Planctomycetota bacterium]